MRGTDHQDQPLLPHRAREGGSLLIVGTLPRPLKMGFNATLDAREFFDLANMIEAAL